MSVELQQLQEHLVDLEVFMASRAYTGYRAARKVEIAELKDRLLLFRPDSQSNIAMQLQIFGELDSQEQMEKTFEDARTTLKARIAEMSERENESAQNTKI